MSGRFSSLSDSTNQAIWIDFNRGLMSDFHSMVLCISYKQMFCAEEINKEHFKNTVLIFFFSLKLQKDSLNIHYHGY